MLRPLVTFFNSCTVLKSACFRQFVHLGGGRNSQHVGNLQIGNTPSDGHWALLLEGSSLICSHRTDNPCSYIGLLGGIDAQLWATQMQSIQSYLPSLFTGHCSLSCRASKIRWSGGIPPLPIPMESLFRTFLLIWLAIWYPWLLTQWWRSRGRYSFFSLTCIPHCQPSWGEAPWSNSTHTSLFIRTRKKFRKKSMFTFSLMVKITIRRFFK